MRRLLLASFLLLLCTPLIAQTVDSTSPTQDRFALITITKYCSHMAAISSLQPPRIFAQTAADPEPSSAWREFESRDTWVRAGSPSPGFGVV